MSLPRRHTLTLERRHSAMSLLQEFGVSCLSASLAHIPHHPLYTLKSQMMYYGRDFSFFNFVRRAKVTKGTFLFQGSLLLYLYVLSCYIRSTCSLLYVCTVIMVWVKITCCIYSLTLPYRRFSSPNVWHRSRESAQDAGVGSGRALGRSPRGEPDHHQVDDGRRCSRCSHHHHW